MRMRFKQMSNGVGSYAVSNANRWFYGLFCLFIGLGFASVLIDGGLTVAAIVPLVLFVISLIGMGYRESWIFDPHTHTITYTIGFYTWVKRKTYPVSSVRMLEITHFVRGTSPHETNMRPRGRNKAMLVFSLHMQDDSSKDIEILPERTSGGRTEAAAQALAVIMDLPFHADREPDIYQSVSVRDV
jgi:hypothetical protein